MFLTDEELHVLTGYQVRAYQRKWLTSHGWQFDVSRIGRPIVGRMYAEQRTGFAAQQAPQRSAWKPNITAISKRA